MHICRKCGGEMMSTVYGKTMNKKGELVVGAPCEDGTWSHEFVETTFGEFVRHVFGRPADGTDGP